MSDNVHVVFAYPYTDKAGNNHNADASASLPREEAKNLIHFGRARAMGGPVPGVDTAPHRTPKKVAAKKAVAPQAPVADTSEEK